MDKWRCFWADTWGRDKFFAVFLAISLLLVPVAFIAAVFDARQIKEANEQAKRDIPNWTKEKRLWVLNCVLKDEYSVSFCENLYDSYQLGEK